MKDAFSDPKLIWGAILTAVIGLLVYIIQKVIDKWFTPKDRGIPARTNISRVEKLTIQLLYLRRLNRLLDEYKNKLKGRLQNERWSKHYANLYVFPISLQSSSQLSADNIPTLTVYDSIEQFGSQGLVLLGESGSGKSTSIKKAAVQYCFKNNLTPIIIELRNYQLVNSLIMMMAQELGNKAYLERGLKLQKFILFFDGLNEIPNESLLTFIADLNLLRSEFPGNKLVVTCRVADYVDYLPEFVHTKLQHLDSNAIQNYLKSVLGIQEGEKLFSDLDDRLLGFCENPYMLTMLASTYKSTGELPSNRAKLYEGFLTQFFIEESKKSGSKISLNIKHDLLSDLAFYMDNKVVSIDIARVQKIVGQKLIQIRDTFEHDFTAPDVLDELLSNSLISLEFGNVNFIHQSIQEFYTAKEVAERLETGKLRLDDLTEYIDDARWTETLKMLSGLLTDASGFIRVVKKRDLLLAAECIHASSFVDPELVDEAIVQAVTEFKFGTISFNYPLIFSMKQVADRRSQSLSQRVVDDMEHWLEKFAASTPRTLVGAKTEELLLIVEQASNAFILPDAIWTLGSRKEVRAVNPLIDILLEIKSPYRADAARALGKIGDKRSTAALLSCIKPGEPKELRPHCFMALGQIADKSSFQPLLDYVTDLNNPFRETAIWALLGIADEKLSDFLIKYMRKGTAMARANCVYLLGQHRIPEGYSELINLMEVEHDAYVREDIAFALGEYGKEDAVPTLISRLDDPDALVRIRVAEALGKIGSAAALPKLKDRLEDESSFVIESVKMAIESIEKRINN